MRTLTIHFFAKLFVAALMFSFVSVALAQEDQPNLVRSWDWTSVIRRLSMPCSGLTFAKTHEQT